MPAFRIPFTGSLLVEAESEWHADLAAHMWTVSMRQAMHGVKMQPVPEGVEAATIEIGREGIADVSEELAADLEHQSREQCPVTAKLAASLTNYFVGKQADWEMFEFRKRVQGNRANNPDAA